MQAIAGGNNNTTYFFPQTDFIPTSKIFADMMNTNKGIVSNGTIPPLVPTAAAATEIIGEVTATAPAK
jgi:hypothetical protein